MLDETLVALAMAGGTAVVQAAGTDTWASVRKRVAKLLSRGDAERTTTELLLLDQTATALNESGTQIANRARTDHEASWQARFESLLEAVGGYEREQVVAELKSLLEEAVPRVQLRDGMAGNTFTGPTAIQIGDRNRQDIRFGSQA